MGPVTILDPEGGVEKGKVIWFPFPDIQSPEFEVWPGHRGIRLWPL